jgi:hypothetical protein
MAGIDANLDDLQSDIEAFTRTADLLHSDAAGFSETLKHVKNAPVIESLVRRVAELRISARDQRGGAGTARNRLTIEGRTEVFAGYSDRRRGIGRRPVSTLTSGDATTHPPSIAAASVLFLNNRTTEAALSSAPVHT